MEVLLGSQNPIKIEAVKAVFSLNFPKSSINFHAHAVSSQVPFQPIGHSQVFQGALNRAQNVQKWFINKFELSNQIGNTDEKDISYPSPYYFVGVEAGLVSISPFNSGYLAYSVCVIMDHKGHQAVGTSPGWEYPPKVIKAMLQDRNLELASIMAEISGDPDIRSKEGAIGLYSHSRVKRYDLAYNGIQMALIPFLHPHIYFA